MYRSMLRILAVVFSVLFLIPTAVPGPTDKVQTDFGEGRDTLQAVFDKAGEQEVEIPIFSNASYEYCSLDILGLPYRSRHPSNVTVDLGADGAVDWHYAGVLGEVNAFDGGNSSTRFDFSTGAKYNVDESFSLPLKANVTTAGLKVTPKVTASETVFFDVGSFSAMEAVEDELWLTGESGGLIRRNIITDYQEIYTNYDGLNNTVLTALAADEDYIYAGSMGNGVSIFDREADAFSPERWGSENGLGSDNIAYIHSDGKRVFIVTDESVKGFEKFGDFGAFIHEWEVEMEGLPTLEIEVIRTRGSLFFFGTTKGVAIFDDSTKQWTHLTTSNGLPTNTINDIMVDDELLYIATEAGISRYRYSTGSFLIPTLGLGVLPGLPVSKLTQNETLIFAETSHAAEDYVDSVSRISKKTWKPIGRVLFKGNTEIGESSFSDILFSNGRLFITTSAGVYGVMLPSEQVSFTSPSNNMINSNYIREIFHSDPEDMLYLATDNGIGRYDLEDRMFLEPWSKKTGLITDDIRTLVASDEYIYAGTKELGVARWSKTEETWKNPIDSFSGLSSPKIRQLAVEKNSLYIANEKGIDKYNALTEQVTENWGPETFNTSKVIVNDIMADEDFMYVAHSPVFGAEDELLFQGGFWIYNISNSSWLTFTNATPENLSLSSNNVNCLAQNQSYIFIGTDDGLNIMDKDTNEVEVINHSSRPAFIGDGVRTLFYGGSPEPSLYIMTDPLFNDTGKYEYGGGLFILDPGTGNITGPFNSSDGKNEMSTEMINSIIEIDNKLMLGTNGNGLMRLDLEETSFLDPSQSLGLKQYPRDLSLDIGDDGMVERHIPLFKEEFDLDFTEELGASLFYSTRTFVKDGVLFSEVPVNVSVHPDSMGAVVISDLAIEYAYEFSSGDFSDIVNSFKQDQNATKDVKILNFKVKITSDTPGIVRLTNPLMLYRLSNPPVINIRSPRSYLQGASYWNTEKIEFDATGTFDPDGDTLQYKWRADNDSDFKGTSKTFKAFLAPGKHRITLNVTDSKGRYATQYVDIEVDENIPPTPVINRPENNDTFFSETEILFDATGTIDLKGGTLSYYWYSDSEHSAKEFMEEGKRIRYSFDRTGYYNITLIADDGALSATATVGIFIVDSELESGTKTFNSNTMENVEVHYDVTHSVSQVVGPTLGELDVVQMTVDEGVEMPNNMTHIGIGFTINHSHKGTVYGETVKISYPGQRDFLSNIDNETLALYKYNGSKDEDEKWTLCPTLERDDRKHILIANIEQVERDHVQVTEFLLLANITKKIKETLSVEVVSPGEGSFADPETAVIMLKFNHGIIESTLEIGLYDKNEIRLPFKFGPNFDEEEKMLSFRVDELDHDEDYEIRLDFVMDEYRGVERDFTYTFRTAKEETDPGRPLWLWIGIGAVIGLTVIGLLVYFLVVRPRRYVEDLDMEEEVFSCPRCGFILEEEREECPECGFKMEKKTEAVVEAEFVKCPKCGSTIDARSKLCPFCSQPLAEEEEVEEVVEEEEEEYDIEEMGLPMDVECPTCGELVEEGMTECPACGEIEFNI